MTDHETYTLCPYCRERVEPDEPGVVHAVEILDAPGMGQAYDYIDGMGGFFHTGCPPEAVGYARRPRPA